MAEDPVLAAANPNNNPRITQLLAEAINDEQRLQLLDEKINALSVEMSEKRARLQEEYRRSYEKRFKGIDPKRALVGARAEHRIPVGGIATYTIVVPSGQRTHEVSKFVQEAPEDLTPISQAEGILLGWLSEVQLHGSGGEADQPPQKLLEKPAAKRLQLIRALPEQTINRLAEECNTLQTWLNIILEQELGNS